MILIEFREGQGLGNQLWYYASAKSIADKLNFELVEPRRLTSCD